MLKSDIRGLGINEKLSWEQTFIVWVSGVVVCDQSSELKYFEQ